MRSRRGVSQNDRGLAHLQLQDLPRALLDFSQAIRLNPNDYRAYFNRGCAYGKYEEYSGAIEDFSKVIELNPNDGQAYVNRGIAYHQLGYEQAAITDLHQAAEFFRHQGESKTYQKTLDLMKVVQQEIPSQIEVALLF